MIFKTDCQYLCRYSAFIWTNSSELPSGHLISSLLLSRGRISRNCFSPYLMTPLETRRILRYSEYILNKSCFPLPLSSVSNSSQYLHHSMKRNFEIGINISDAALKNYGDFSFTPFDYLMPSCFSTSTTRIFF